MANVFETIKLMVKNLAKNKKGQSAKGLVGVLVAVIVAVTMIPLIADSIAGATNLTAGQTTILNIVPTFIVLGILFVVAKKMGLF